jgi:hypothetical protein
MVFCNMNKVVFFLSILLFLHSSNRVFAQVNEDENEELTDQVPEEQKLFFVPSFSNLTGFGAGLELDVKPKNLLSKRKYIFGLVLGAGAPNLVRPLFKGNKINIRIFGAMAISRAQLLLGWYFGSFGFDAPVDAAYFQSPTVSIRFSLDKRQLWLVELGSTPFIPERYENNGLSINPANAPPFLFFTLSKRLTERKPRSEEPVIEQENSESYPPVFIK